MFLIPFITFFISSIVLRVGCDDIVNGQEYDVCGICGGDNSTCRLVSGLFTKPFLRPGYNYIADIPERACNLNISSLKKTSNSFALRFKNGTYFVNGDSFSVGGTSTTYAAGTAFTYHHKTRDGDFVFAPGPTSQPLELFLLYRQTNTGLKYEYRMPFSVSPSTTNKKDKILSRHAKHAMMNSADKNKYDYRSKSGDGDDDNIDTDGNERSAFAATPNTFVNSVDSDEEAFINDKDSASQSNDGGTDVREYANRSFKWAITSYTPCSRTCGEGTKIGMYSCVQRENDEDRVVADRKCVNEAIRRPDNAIVACSLSACPAEWIIGEWGPCSVSCSEGVERRDLVCARQTSLHQKLQVDGNECATSEPPNILRTRPCFRNPCNNGTSVQPYWRAGTWSMCSARCGIGKKTRMVKCVAEREDECSDGDRPPAETSCDMGPCSSHTPAEWLTTEWSTKCTEKCGSGIQTRKVVCAASDQEKCSEDTKPESTRQCFSTDQCASRWLTGPWSPCSVECGWGKQSRTSVCVAYDTSNKSPSIVADGNCSTERKPAIEQACFSRECDAVWYFSDWSSCSRSCGSGIRTRRVRCLNENYAPDLNCKDEDRPVTKQVCTAEKCLDRVEFGENTASKSIDSLNNTDPNCTDSNANCNLVLKTRLCNYKYYQQSCCRSCSGTVLVEL